MGRGSPTHCGLGEAAPGLALHKAGPLCLLPVLCLLGRNTQPPPARTRRAQQSSLPARQKSAGKGYYQWQSQTENIVLSAEWPQCNLDDNSFWLMSEFTYPTFTYVHPVPLAEVGLL